MTISFDRAPAPVEVTLQCEGGDVATRTRWSIRPLTPAELSAAIRSAGPVPVRGRRVLSSGAPPSTPEDEAAAAQALEWTYEHHRLLCEAALVAVNGEMFEDAHALLESIRPASLYPSVIIEMGGRILEVSDLSPKERASYGSPSGSGGTEGAAGGGATNAKTGPC